MYKIREYDVKDKEQIIELWLDVCVEEFHFQKWKNDMVKLNEDEYEKILVAIFDEKIIGTMAYKKNSNDIAELKRVYIHKDHRGKGIAKKMYMLISEIIKECKYKEILVETWEEFDSGIDFYYRNNFKLKLKDNKRYVFALNI